MKINLAIVAVSAALLCGCSETGTESTAPPIVTQARHEDAVLAEFLTSISAVWVIPGDGLFRISYREGGLVISVGDVFKQVIVRGIDTTNDVLNLAATDGGLITVRKVWDDKRTSFTLALFLSDGEQSQLGFVRRLTAEDHAFIDAGLARSAAATDGVPPATIPAAAPLAADSIGESTRADPADVARHFYDTADQELNTAYKARIAALAADDAAALRKEERAWIKARILTCGGDIPRENDSSPSAIHVLECSADWAKARAGVLGG